MLEKMYYESKPLLCFLFALAIPFYFDGFPSWGRLFLFILAVCGLLIAYQRGEARGLVKAPRR